MTNDVYYYEMTEDNMAVMWPLDNQNEPIKPGQQVYVSDDAGITRIVSDIIYHNDGRVTVRMSDDSVYTPYEISHQWNDSIEDITNSLNDLRIKIHDKLPKDDNDMLLDVYVRMINYANNPKVVHARCGKETIADEYT
jgi:hypothetical protein